jgi:fructan beta-fructosidase
MQKRYLNLPIQNSAPLRPVTLFADGTPEVVNQISLADSPDEADWWAFIDTHLWPGKTVTLDMPERLVVESDELIGSETLYREKLRPKIHFSSRRGWLNDPNGLVFYDNNYHLFYQHNPYGWSWGNMHWGHATSADLVHWTEHGDVLMPDFLGAMFSGSAVVDWENTTGFGENGKPPLVLIYTASGDPTTQCLAFSNDGFTFTKFSGNPVLPQITPGNRDPKVFWHVQTQKWIMVLYVEMPEKRHTVQFFRSPDLKAWEWMSTTEGGIDSDQFLYECPDFFELEVDGDENNKKWVLTAANSSYSIGSFDGTTFTPEFSDIPDVQGKGFYAAQTFSDISQEDGRRIQIGWIRADSPGMPFNQLMSLPSVLSLKSTTDGPRLARTPIEELKKLRDGAETHSDCFELKIEITESVKFDVSGVEVGCDFENQELMVRDHKISAPLISGKQNLVIFVDRTVMEIYASDGLVYLTLPNLTRSKVLPKEGKIYPLRSLWET